MRGALSDGHTNHIFGSSLYNRPKSFLRTCAAMCELLIKRPDPVDERVDEYPTLRFELGGVANQPNKQMLAVERHALTEASKKIYREYLDLTQPSTASNR